MNVMLSISSAAGHRVDVRVSLDGEVTVGDLRAALVEELGGELGVGSEDQMSLAGHGHLDLDDLVSSLELRHGDLIEFAPGADRRKSTAAQLTIIEGPERGRRITLRVGTTVLGRDPGSADIAIGDPSVSRRHAAIDVGPDGLQVHDLGSRNGVLVNDGVVTAPIPLVEGSRVTLGDSTLVVEAAPADAASARNRPTARHGTVPFNRPPRIVPVRSEVTFDVPAPPDAPRPQRFPMAAALVPVVLGVLAFAVLREPSTLLFLALGPLMVIMSVVDSRRSGRSDFRRASERFATESKVALTRIEEANEAHRVRVERLAPAPATVVELAAEGAPQVWERRPADEDFLAVRLGRAEQAAPTQIKVPDTGDPSILASLRDEVRRRSVILDLPVVVGLKEVGVLGVAGGPADTSGVLRSCLVQLAGLHSPRDLSVVAVVGHDQAAWEWLQWLPHCRNLFGDGEITVVASVGAAALLDRLIDTVQDRSRRSQAREQVGRSVVVVIDDGALVDADRLHRLAAAGPSVGVHVVVGADRATGLPGECGAVLEVTGPATLTVATSSTRVVGIDIEPTSVPEARRCAVALAPLVDVGGASASRRLPDVALLLDLLALEPPDPEQMRRRWERPLDAGVVIGVAESGEVVVDLSQDGPHMVVAGTTGSGKSEFLQTFIVSLAASYGPDTLQFVLVDYKGGAAFKDLVHLPHTVGFVTDLDGHLARRALVSLDAELTYRERLLATAGAKDLAEMAALVPDVVLPSLILVFDEFAALRHDVPEFISGVVDIAQRGRSLGVHLVLATQSPSGIVDDKIRANTNLWVALRTRGEQESRDILGSGHGEAALIPTSRRGRGYVRRGADAPQLFQSAYVGERRSPGARPRRVTVERFDLAQRPPTVRVGGPIRVAAEQATDLQRLVAAARVAATGYPAARRPWLDPLPGQLDLVDIEADVPPQGLAVGLGRVDLPALQSQAPWILDLDAVGHLLVIGGSGSGKTTLLRTIAATLATRFDAERVWIYGLDFAGGGLAGIEALPQCGSVIPGNDDERVDRLLSLLEAEVRRRQAWLAERGGVSLSELRRSVGSAPPAIVLLLDGYAGFEARDDVLEHGRSLDRLAALLGTGRAVGVHIVLTASRRSGLATSVTSQIACQVCLQLSDPEEYGWMDLADAAKGMAFVPGRGLLREGAVELQVALVGGRQDTVAQNEALAEIGRRTAARQPTLVAPPIGHLREMVPLSEVQAMASGDDVPMAVESTTLSPCGPVFDTVTTFLVVGPSGSGRSTALASSARSLLALRPGLPAFAVSLRPAPAFDTVPWEEVHVGHRASVEVLSALAARVGEVAERHESWPALLVVDDADDLEEGAATMAMESIARRAREVGIVLMTSVQAYSAHRAFGGWLGVAKKNGQGLLLWPDREVDGDLLHAAIPRRGPTDLPPGRGYLVRRGRVQYVQVAQ